MTTCPRCGARRTPDSESASTPTLECGSRQWVHLVTWDTVFEQTVECGVAQGRHQGHRVPLAIRREARAVLKHFPWQYDVAKWVVDQECFDALRRENERLKEEKP